MHLVGYRYSAGVKSRTPSSSRMATSIRHFTIRPWLAALGGSALLAIAIGYLLATSYLVLRDDLIGASTARQARIQQAYEDRISALRAQVDRITSRQLLDQQLMEEKVTELLDRQSKLSARHGRLGTVLDRAAAELPDQATDPGCQAGPACSHQRLRAGRDRRRRLGAVLALANAQGFAADESAADHADKLFVAINQSLRSIESEQMARVTTLAANAYDTADKIADALEAAGLPVDSEYGKQGVGGPLIAVDGAAAFDTKVKELDEALDQLDALKKEARSYPIANPAPGRPISSGFGVRKDPLLGTPALHSGIDFRAQLGCQRACHGAGRRGQGRMERRLWPHGRGRPRQRFFDTLRASEPHRREGRRSSRARRRHRRSRQQRPLDRPASALRSPPQWRRHRSAGLPQGRHEGRQAALKQTAV